VPGHAELPIGRMEETNHESHGNEGV
jgi:hypothetical protein